MQWLERLVSPTQVLVDTLLLLAPLALYAKLGAASVALNGVLVCFYRGLPPNSSPEPDPEPDPGVFVCFYRGLPDVSES